MITSDKNFNLETNRLLLVPISMKHFESRSRIASDIENTRFMMFLPATKEETFEYIKKCETAWLAQNQSLFEFAILLKSENNKFIGGIALELLQSNPQITETFGDNVADLGWILDKNYWNHGFVTEAAFAVVKLAKSLGYKKLIAQCDKDNIGSYRVMEKIGMTLFSNDGVRFNKCEPNVPKTELMYTMDL